jgi:transcriptional regulator with XRE-family HTH domain
MADTIAPAIHDCNRHVYCRPRNTLGVSTIGERIRTLRISRRLSQPELAQRIGIKQPSLHNIESDKTKTLRGETLAGLCRELNVSPDVLLGKRKIVSEEALLHEAEMIGLFRSMPHEAQNHVLAIARALATTKGKPKSGDPKPRTTRPQDAQHITGHGELTED